MCEIKFNLTAITTPSSLRCKAIFWIHSINVEFAEAKRCAMWHRAVQTRNEGQCGASLQFKTRPIARSTGTALAHVACYIPLDSVARNRASRRSRISVTVCWTTHKNSKPGRIAPRRASVAGKERGSIVRRVPDQICCAIACTVSGATTRSMSSSVFTWPLTLAMPSR